MKKTQLTVTRHIIPKKIRVMVYISLSVLTVIEISVGTYKFYAVRKFMEMGGVDLNELLVKTDFRRVYSGFYLEAIKQLYGGFFHFMLMVVYLTLWGSFRAYFKEIDEAQIKEADSFREDG